jgi:2-keto-4-pentenoate hydratase/2-oxohepta-3-ene-1,7-dioic acid hydratase in catechol pathway
MSFRLLSFQPTDGRAPRAGLQVNNAVVDLEAAVNRENQSFAVKTGTNLSSVLAVVQNWDILLPLLEAASDNIASMETKPLEEVKCLAPLLYPTNIFCAAANYQDHFKEMSGKEADKTKFKPYFFTKAPHQTVIGTGAPILRPKVTEMMDWEVEIAVVIGRSGRNIKLKDAMDHVAGYTIINDLSARNFLKRPDWPNMSSDWLWQKTFDTSAPMGPWITPKSEIADPHNLFLKTWVNDTLEQDTHSKHMVFTIPEQIHALSEHFTLLAGDVIATGTGGGVGHKKGRYLNPGDTCRLEIEGLGELTNPIIGGK